MNRFSYHFLATLLCAFAACNTARSQIVIESLDGPVTPQEISSFKDALRQTQPRGDNNHNNFVYGNAGGAAEAAGNVYEITHDREILDQLIRLADLMLAGRNDPQTGRLIWTGKRDLVWPNGPQNPPGGTYSATENGDVIAHIAYAARLVLQNQSLWNEKPGIGDPNHFGQTYLDRAQTYVRECDKTIDTFIVPWLVDAKTNRYHFPDSPLYAAIDARQAKAVGKPVPWNQQMMLNGGFQRMAECHELLGDAPDRVNRYDAIVQASIDWFFDEMIPYQLDGHDCYKWSYGIEAKTLRHVEDSSHGGYDILIYRAYLSGRYGITRQQMQPLGNVALYALAKPDGTFAGKVDGTGSTHKILPATWLYLCDFVPELYPIAGKADLPQAKSKLSTAGRLLWVKHYRNIGHFPAPPTRQSAPIRSGNGPS